jgi:PAS domain S-box-containing protein
LTIDIREGQAILSAVRAGAVDAIVVAGPDGDRIYTLQGADESYRILIERMNEGALLLSTEGDILYCNRRFADLLGRSMTEMCGHSLADHVAEDDRRRWAALLDEAGKGEIRGELHLQCPGAGPVPVLASLNAVELTGVSAITAVLTDLTEHKRMQERLQELQRQQVEMEHMAAAGRMAARVAHEINNPLGGVKNAFLLLKGAVPSDHRYAHYVPRIESEIDRIAQIVQQMFHLCRPEATGDLQPLSCVVADVAAFQELACQKRAVTLTTDIAKDCIQVPLPGQALRQILHNLLHNALDVSPNGAEIALRAVSVPDPEGVRISVADQGPGIPPERQPFIFEPFYTTKKAHADSGLGLGLSICHSLVSQLGGTLTFKSEPGQGTVFTVFVPVPPERLPRPAIP